MRGELAVVDFAHHFTALPRENQLAPLLIHRTLQTRNILAELFEPRTQHPKYRLDMHDLLRIRALIESLAALGEIFLNAAFNLLLLDDNLPMQTHGVSVSFPGAGLLVLANSGDGLQ